MQSLKRFCLRAAESAIRQTRWLKSAPADDRAGATFKIVGVQERVFRGIVSRATPGARRRMPVRPIRWPLLAAARQPGRRRSDRRTRDELKVRLG